MTIEVNGLECNCGNRGCFEKYASMKALKERLLKEWGEENLAGEEINKILSEKINEEKTSKVIEEYMQYLTIGLSNLINIFEPDTISLGGSFVHYKDILLERLKEALKKNKAIFNGEQIPKIVVAKLKNDAGIIGAVL